MKLALPLLLLARMIEQAIVVCIQTDSCVHAEGSFTASSRLALIENSEAGPLEQRRVGK